jgi:polysaccharide biosynthesis transport protein
MARQLPDVPGANGTARAVQRAGASVPVHHVEPAREPPRIPRVRRHLLALRRHRWWIVGILLLGSGLGYVVARSGSPTYVAHATLWIDVANRGEAGPLRPGALLVREGWIDLLRSRAVLDTIVLERRLYLFHPTAADSALFRDFRVRDDVVPGTYRLTADGGTWVLATPRDSVLERAIPGAPIGEALGFRWTPPPAALTEGRTATFTVSSPAEASRRLAARLRAGMSENSSLLALEISARTPASATATLQAVVERYVAVTTELKRARTRELSSILDEQLGAARQNLRADEEALQAFRTHAITLPSDRGGGPDPTLNSFFSLSVEREQVRRDRAALQSALTAGRLSASELEAIPSVSASSALTQALQQLTTQRANLAGLGATYTEEHRTVRQAREELGVLERQTLPALTGTLLSELAAREQALGRLLGTASGELRQIPARAVEDARLRRQVEISENLYRVLQQRSDEARIAAATTVPDVRVLDPPSASRGLGGQSPAMILFLFVLGSGAAGIGVALALDRMGTRVVYPDQVSEETGLSVLATIPNVNRIGRLGPAAAMAQAMEAFRVARVNLLFAHGTAGPLILAVTSPSAGDGKSFVSAHLARTFAEAGQRTLIIDGDTRRGTLHRHFMRDRRPGLTEQLSGLADVDTVIRQTELPALDFIACGMRTREAPALLGTGALARLLQELKTRYQVIIMDTPPLAAGVDPLIFGTLARDVVVVLRAGATQRQMVGSMLDALDRLPVRVLGAVLNDVSESGIYQYYGYLPSYQAHDELAGPEVRQLQPS